MEVYAMRTMSEAAARLRAALEQEIQERERRLRNARFYAEVTAPGAPQESANSHALWCALIGELSEEIAQLRGQLAALSAPSAML